MTFTQLVQVANSRGASDIHWRVGQVPVIRIDGDLIRCDALPKTTQSELETAAQKLLSPEHLESLRQHHQVDCAWQAPGVGRCRASIFQQRGTLGIAVRIVPATAPGLETLGLPPAVASLSEESRGLILVTGATGSGKSTTLAALVDLINRTRALHILTIEDPIEFLHADVRSIVTQREVGVDVATYAAGLKAGLRQDPDVILLGELRDMETIETALVAAETGHLVLSTLHTLDATETVNRIIAVFPPHQQTQIRHQLSRVMRASVSQRLLPRADGNGRVLASEVLISTPYIRDCIADAEKTTSIPGAIAAGVSQYGMQTFDQAITALCRDAKVSVDEAMKWVTNVEEFKMRLRGITSGSETLAYAAPATSPIQRFGS